MSKTEQAAAAAGHAIGWYSNAWNDPIITESMIDTWDACTDDAYFADHVARSTMLQTALTREAGLNAAKRCQIASGILDAPGGGETWEAWIMIWACGHAAEARWAITLSEHNS